MQRDRFLVRSIGGDPEGVRAGLIKLMELLDTHSDGVIVVPEMGKVKDTLLATVLGEDATKYLLKNRVIEFPGNKKISLCAQSTLKNYKYSDLYLVLWGSKYAIQSIEALPSWRSAILVTWLEEDSAEWERENNVSVICGA